MKFILGIVRGKFRPDGTQQVVVKIAARHKGQDYHLDRFEMKEGCDPQKPIFLPKIRVYDTDDYPEAVWKPWAETDQILMIAAGR